MKADSVSTGGTHTHTRTQQMTVHHSDLNTTKNALNDNLNLYTGQRKTHLKPFKMMFYVISSEASGAFRPQPKLWSQITTSGSISANPFLML